MTTNLIWFKVREFEISGQEKLAISKYLQNKATPTELKLLRGFLLKVRVRISDQPEPINAVDDVV